MSVQLVVHVGKAEGLVVEKKDGGAPDTYVKIEVEGKKDKYKCKVVQNSLDPIFEDDVKVPVSSLDDTLVVTVVSKEVARDESICDKLKIPLKELTMGTAAEKVFDLKKKKKAVGKLYLTLTATAGGPVEEKVEGPIKKEKKKSSDKKKGSDKKDDKKRKSSHGDKKKDKKSSSSKKDKKKKEELPATYNINVKCESGRDLVAADKGGVSDPYIVFTVEGSSKKVMNKCVENTVNPVWGDEVVVEGPCPGNDLLKIQVTDKDHKQGSKKDDPIGYAEISVRDLMPFGQPVTKEIPLRKVDKKGRPEKKSKPGDAGYVTLTFHVAEPGHAAFEPYEWAYHPYTLRVKCVQAEDVASKDMNGMSDPYLVCKLKNAGNQQLRKTKTQQKTLNPVWHEEFAFLLNDPKVDVLKCTMFDEDKASKDDKMSKLFVPLADFPINQWQTVEKEMTPIGSANRPGTLFLEVLIEDNLETPPQEPTPEPVAEERVVEVAPVEAKKSSSSSSSKKEGKCKFQWGSYSSSYSTSFSGYTEGKSLSALRSSEEKYHVHAEVKKVEYKPKPKGETLKGKVIEGKNLFQIEKFPGLEAYVEVKLVGKGKDKKGKTIQTDALTAADAQWDKEFDFGRVKKGQAVEIILWMKHAALPEFSQYGYARVEVKNIAWDNEEPQTIQLVQPPKAGFLQRLATTSSSMVRWLFPSTTISTSKFASLKGHYTFYLSSVA